jgi:hypothetical protein
MVAVKKIENGSVTAEEQTRDSARQLRVVTLTEVGSTHVCDLELSSRVLCEILTAAYSHIHD